MTSSAMSSNQTVSETPPRCEASEGTFAIRVDGPQCLVYQYATSSPFRSTPDWRKIDEYDRATAPPVDLSAAEFVEDQADRTWVFAHNVTPEREITADTVEEVPTPEPSHDPQAKYAIKFENGKYASGNSQSASMANAVEVLAEDYGLLEKIDIPHMSGPRNALVSDRPRHPDGREMDRPMKIGGGLYVHTKPSADQKIKYLEDLAEMCGVEIEFTRGW